MCGLFKRGAVKVSWAEEVGTNPKILGSSFVLTIKGTETDEPLCKARFVVKGHTDAENNLFVNSAANVQKSSLSMLIGLAAVFCYRIWSQDVAHEYLQSAQKLKIEVFIRPPKEFQLDYGELLELLKPLYGLTDAGDYWNDNFSRHLKGDMTMKPTSGDLEMFTKIVRDNLACMVGVYVDDTISTGPPEFEEESRATERKLESKGRSNDCFNFVGIEVEKRGNGYLIHQCRYGQKM